MGESESSSDSQSFLRRYWNGYTEFWGERFSFLENFTRFIEREKTLPSWSSADVEEFIASDPVHGPTLKTAREAVNYGVAGSVIGAVSTAGVAWKYSRSLHGEKDIVQDLACSILQTFLFCGKLSVIVSRIEALRASYSLY